MVLRLPRAVTRALGQQIRHFGIQRFGNRRFGIQRLRRQSQTIFDSTRTSQAIHISTQKRDCLASHNSNCDCLTYCDYLTSHNCDICAATHDGKNLSGEAPGVRSGAHTGANLRIGQQGKSDQEAQHERSERGKTSQERRRDFPGKTSQGASRIARRKARGWKESGRTTVYAKGMEKGYLEGNAQVRERRTQVHEQKNTPGRSPKEGETEGQTEKRKEEKTGGQTEERKEEKTGAQTEGRADGRIGETGGGVRRAEEGEGTEGQTGDCAKGRPGKCKNMPF